jgi:hypothetical protein
VFYCKTYGASIVFRKIFHKVLIMRLHCSMQKIEKLTAVPHSVDNQPSNRHVYYAQDRFELPHL